MIDINTESDYINECLQKYNDIPLDSNGNKDWTKAIPFYFDIQQKVGIRKLNEFIYLLDSLSKNQWIYIIKYLFYNIK